MKQINKNIIWNAVGNTAYNGLQWLITVIVTRKSGFETAGVLAIAMSVSLTFRAISYFGIRNFQITDTSGKYADHDYFGLRIITSLAAFVLCTMVSFFSGYDPYTFIAVVLYMIFRVSEGFSDLFQGIMQKNERLDIAGICLFVKAAITTIAFIIGFYILSSLNIGLLLMSASALVISFIFEFKVAERCAGITLKLSFSFCRKLASETVPMFIYILESALILNAPKYFLSIVSDEAAVGIYSSVFSIALIWQGAFQYVYVPFITKFSKLENQKNYGGIKRSAINIICIFVGITVLFSSLSAAFGDDILTLIFGYSEYYKEIMIPAVLSVCTYSTATFLSTFSIIKRKFFGLVTAYAAGVAVFVAAAKLTQQSCGISSASYGLISASVFIGIWILVDLYVSRKNTNFTA